MITVEKLEKGTYFDDAFKISFRYDPTTVAKVKELAERRYLPEDRAWEIPAHELPALIEKVGLKVILIQPESEYGEELLDMLLDYIRSGKVGLAVLDSAPFIIPKAVQEKGLDEKSYGGNSALMKAFCDKAVPLCKKVECTFLMINQLRENIGNPYKPYKIPCGTAIAHACSQILWFTKGSLLDEKYKEVSSGYANPSGNLVSVKVEKNKVTKNDRRLQTYTLNYSTGVDEIKDTLDLAIMLGIISQAGAWFKATLKDGKEQKMQGFNGVQEFYYNDLEELEYLRKQVYEAGMV